MAVDSPSGYKVIRDEFDMDNISTAVADGIRWLVSSDAGNTAFAVGANRGSFTAQGATDATDDDMVEIGHALIGWRGQDGHMWMEARVQLDVVTNVAFNMGFNDDQLEDSNTLPMEVGTALTSNAATWVGIVYDTDTTDPDVCRGTFVDDDIDDARAIADMRLRTGGDSGASFTPTAARWFTCRVDLWDRGAGNGLRAEYSIVDDSTGTRYFNTVNSSVDRDALLTPHFAFENRSATAHVVDLDYIEFGKSRS